MAQIFFQNPKTGCDLALEHFDTFYRPVYGNLWPSVRISLLTTKKTAAVLNNYASFNEDLQSKLSGTYDIVEEAACILEERLSEGKVTQNESIQAETGKLSSKFIGNAERHSLDEKGEIHEDLNVELTNFASECKSECDENLMDEASRTDLNVFVPAKNVYSERDMLQMEEMSQSMYTPGDVKVNFARKSDWTLPEDLQVMVYPKGDINTFPDPKGSLLSKLGLILGNQNAR